MAEPIPSSDQTEPKAQDGTETKLTQELKAIAEANSEATPDAHLDDMEIHQPGAEMSNKEKLAMRNLFEKYPEDQQEVLVQIGEGESAVEVRLCGEGKLLELHCLNLNEPLAVRSMKYFQVLKYILPMTLLMAGVLLWQKRMPLFLIQLSSP